MSKEKTLRVFIEVETTPSLLQALDSDKDLAGNPAAASRLSAAGLEVDPDWVPMSLSRGDGARRTAETKVFRGHLPPGRDGGRALDIIRREHPKIGVYADPRIDLCGLGPSDPACGTVIDVGRKLGSEDAHRRGCTGEGVTVALVDSGIDISYLHDKGHTHSIDPDFSLVAPSATQAPGEFEPAGHGTLAAYAVGVMAPGARLGDCATVLDGAAGDGPLMHAWLSDISIAYRRMKTMLESQLPDERRLVVSNSWALTRPDWDFEPDQDENFSDNDEHPFNVLVTELIELGADVLFAAGNCGHEHPVSQCGFLEQPICGANSLSAVTTVGAIDLTGKHLGYSSSGPGRLALEKPDLCAYSHFDGSGVMAVDWGTSVATPLLAGVVAGVRSQRSPVALPPEDLRRQLCETAVRTASTHDPDVGWGAVDPAALHRVLGL